ncbi:unnamed protein product [Adineta ricciae]|uniref:F-box domain-containing protein n=1 Tax=Adineta ricciae TaxID=249248 RepID=A0A815IGG0_ADIRI|nr:unnamed protein product [Adineta ricciae]
MLQFEDVSNDLILCVWDHLVAADVIYSFSNLNSRINSLLSEFCGLFNQLDLRYCSLPACRFFCRQVTSVIEWRLNLTVLKLGNRYRCSQTDMLAEEIIKSFVANHFAKIEKPYDNVSEDIFRSLITNGTNIPPIFPRLISLVVYQPVPISEVYRDVLLFSVANGSLLRSFTWNSCASQTYHSSAFFDWLFRYSTNLVNYKLQTAPDTNGFELKYDHATLNTYIPHSSLINLTIHILNLSTLHILLHYLPQLEHLDVHVSSMSHSNNNEDQKLNYPKNLRVMNLRYFSIEGQDCSCLERLVDKFSETLEKFSLFLIHYCRGDIDMCFNGCRLATLCKKLSRLQSIHFAIHIPLMERATHQILCGFIQAFRTPFWLDGPLGCIQVCVNYHQINRCVQMCSLPYTFTGSTLFHTIDLIDALFNNIEEEKQIQTDLSTTLASLWRETKWLFISFTENQKIPISFLRALHCPYSRVLVISCERGILPDKIDDQLQLTHFSTLQLNSSFDFDNTYDFAQSIAWFRLLPKVKCLYVNSTELKHWLTIDHNKQQLLNTFLRQLDRLYINCSPLININQNEEIMLPLLSFIINAQCFPNLKYLRFVRCKYISSSWININQWIEFIFLHINEHQLKCLRFDFIEKEKELPDVKTTDELIKTTEFLCTINIQRFVSENHISYWIERK